MALSFSDIQTLVRERRGNKVISRATVHQNWIKFHAEKHVTPYLSDILAQYLAWVATLLPESKVATFKALFKFPVLTNDICDTIFDELSRIFDGRNPAYNYQFMSSEQRDDWEWYRQERLHEPNVWSHKGWEYFKTEINSVLIVDLPREQDASDRYPQPYFYWLPINQVVSYESDPATGIMRWIMFRQPDHRLAVIDDVAYRVFDFANETIGALEIESLHDLGYCPARFFWDEPLSLQDPDVKASPLTRVLNRLNWHLFFAISKRHLDLYGAYPIYSGYEQACDYHTSEGTHCDHGFLKDKDDNALLNGNGKLVPCPNCSKRRLAGAGTFIEVPIPNGGNGFGEVPDLRNPVQMLTADVSSLSFNVDEEQRQRDNIISSVVGVGSSILNMEAVNERQVDANFESRSTVLNRVKKGFEAAQQFVDETVCRLRYGGAFISAKVNYGTEFYTLTPAELRERYRAAKESGASEAELDAMRTQLIETEYRHNPTELQRLLILSDLEPYRHMTRAEVVSLHAAGLITDDDLLVKLHFADYVRRFERDNINVIEFGSQVPYSRKIEIINQKFKDYAKAERAGLSGRAIEE